MTVSKKLLFAITFGLLLAGRLSIAGTGYLEDTDEWLYIWIHQHHQEFGQSATWVRCMFDMQGQPPEILIRLLEYDSLLPVAAVMGKQPLHPDVLFFIGIYNIVASLLILYIFFRILLKLRFGFELALAGMALLGTLFNYNMHTRHILPYDHAMLLQLVAFNLLLSDELNLKTCLIAGLISAIGLTSYYGSFMFIFINGGLIVLRYYQTPLSAFKKCVLFVLPFMMVALSYELFTRVNGRSYFSFLAQYSTTVNLASYDEGFDYLFRYFWMVEKWWGVLLLLLFFGGCLLLLKMKNSLQIKQVLFLGIVAYISYGAVVFFTHKIVFHGRILHMYYPFIIIGGLVVLQQQKWLNTRLISLTVMLFAFINYSFVIKDFNRIGYPRNTIYKYHLFEEKGKVRFNYYEEMASPIHYYERNKWYIDSMGPGVLPPGKYALGNLCFNFHYPDSAIHIYPPYPIKEKDSVVLEQLHFQSHPAYALEYCTRNGRNIFISKQLKIRIIKMNI